MTTHSSTLAADTLSVLLSSAISAAHAVNAAANLGEADVAGLPLLKHVARRYVDQVVSEFTSGFNAQRFLLSPDELRESASASAERYTMLARDRGGDVALAAARRAFGDDIPGDTAAGQLARICDASFWSRHYRRVGKRAQEFARIRGGFVAGTCEHYASDAAVNQYRAYRAAQVQYLQQNYVVDRRLNALGKHSFRPLADVTKSDDARRAKLWAFLSGIEQLSVESGLSCALLTLTLPAAYHANPSSGGTGFDGVSTPRDGARRLAKLWNCIQRDLANDGISVSGARFVEPHKDGTPHWHVWLHYADAHLPAILAVIARYFPGDASKRVAAVRVRTVEKDAFGKLFNKRDGSHFTEHFHRFDVASSTLVPAHSRFKAQVDLSVINRAYANGATYASKYAMKTLSEGDTSERVAASRWVWGMRAFQLFGVRNCLGAWDELFRATEVPVDPAARALFDAVHNKPGVHRLQVRNLATGKVEEVDVEGGTAAFIRLQGGLAAAGGSCVDVLKVRIRYTKVLNRYGEYRPTRIGFMILREDEILDLATTREPGRFVLVSGRNLEQAIRQLSPLH